MSASLIASDLQGSIANKASLSPVSLGRPTLAPVPRGEAVARVTWTWSNPVFGRFYPVNALPPCWPPIPLPLC